MVLGEIFMSIQLLIEISLMMSSIRITCPCNEEPPYTPLLYSKTGVYRGIHIFLIFALKHSVAVLTCTHNLCFEQKKRKLSQFCI